ncbi:MAG: hypothetical protein OXU23_27885 [Candidatus Poribacteria bacterium]|nr:hypothetical protein [Candidatus Poribacteria bacterium]
MIVTDKSYIKTPPDDTELIHYLNIYQLLSMLHNKQIMFIPVAFYRDVLESDLSLPSLREVKKHLLWEDNTPVKKDENFTRIKEIVTYEGDDETKQFHRKHYLDEFWRIHSFEHLIYSFSRHFMFTHCWSISNTESILMWDRYRHQDSAIAIRTTVGNVKDAFSESQEELYIGKIKYRNYEKEHITGFQGFSDKNLSDPNIIEELFYQPIFHKQDLYETEDEVRIVISYKYATESIIGKTYLTDIPFFDHSWGFHGNPEPRMGGFRRDGTEMFITDSTNENEKYRWVRSTFPVNIKIDKLIDQIILSPYTAPYALSLMKDLVKKYSIDPDKVNYSLIQLQ